MPKDGSFWHAEQQCMEAIDKDAGSHCAPDKVRLEPLVLSKRYSYCKALAGPKQGFLLSDHLFSDTEHKQLTLRSILHHDCQRNCHEDSPKPNIICTCRAANNIDQL